MTARIVVEPMERSLPTSVAYRSERITSFRVEADASGVGKDAEAVLKDVAEWRRLQLADLDAQEAALRERYDMPVPDKPGDREARILAARRAQGLPAAGEAGQARADLAKPGGDFRTADQSVSMPVPPIADAPPARANPPPSAMAPVSEGTKDELRAVADQLIALGQEPYLGGVPASEAQAREVLKANRARLFDAAQGKPRPAAPEPAKPAGDDIDFMSAAAVRQELRRLAMRLNDFGRSVDSVPPKSDAEARFRLRAMRRMVSDLEGRPAVLPGASMKGADRRCGHPAHLARELRPISAREWDASHAAYGKPLCDTHMAEERSRKGGR